MPEVTYYACERVLDIVKVGLRNMPDHSATRLLEELERYSNVREIMGVSQENYDNATSKDILETYVAIVLKCK
jgi:hypothetical protein